MWVNVGVISVTVKSNDQRKGLSIEPGWIVWPMIWILILSFKKDPPLDTPVLLGFISNHYFATNLSHNAFWHDVLLLVGCFYCGPKCGLLELTVCMLYYKITNANFIKINVDAFWSLESLVGWWTGISASSALQPGHVLQNDLGLWFLLWHFNKHKLSISSLHFRCAAFNFIQNPTFRRK